MNIEDKRYENNTICFSEVNIGKAFQFCNNIYIKVERVIEVDKSVINAINLLDGTAHFFLPDSDVTLLPNSKVVIF